MRRQGHVNLGETVQLTFWEAINFFSKQVCTLIQFTSSLILESYYAFLHFGMQKTILFNYFRHIFLQTLPGISLELCREKWSSYRSWKQARHSLQAWFRNILLLTIHPTLMGPDVWIPDLEEVGAVLVDAGHPDNEDRGHDQEGVVHRQPQQQRVHRAGHRGPGTFLICRAINIGMRNSSLVSSLSVKD